MFRTSLVKKTAISISALLIAFQFNESVNAQTINDQNLGIMQINSSITTPDYSWNNTIPEKDPAPGTSNGKLVLFDNSHGETAGQADWVLDGGFSDFADDLVSHGYTVKEYRGIDKNGDGVIRYYDDRQAANVNKNEEVITYDAIKDADVFVMAEANRPFTIAEQDALKQFVDSGKGIYFIADHYNSDRNMNTWDSTETYDGYNRSTSDSYNIGGAYGDLRNPQDASKGWLAQTFGLRFRFNAINLTSGFSGIKSVKDSEGITQDVKPILMAAGSTLSIVDGSKAKGIVYLSSTDKPTKWPSAADKGLYFGGEAEGPYVAISKPSHGKAAFIGDSSPIEDSSAKYMHEGTGKAKSNHDGYKSTGTAAKLSLNIINWLSNSEAYVGFDGVNHTKGIATPTPMADIEKNQTQAEPWATPTYDPWNTDTYAYGSYNAPQGPNNSSTVNVTGISLDKTSTTINVGSTQTLLPTVIPTNATNKAVTWSSSNTTVATVSNGVVTANAAGTAVITVTTVDGNKAATCNVTVSNSTTTVSVTGVSLDNTSATINVGDSKTLIATVAPANATNKNVTWSSSNTTVATVSNGVVTANAAGAAVITVTTNDGAKTATSNITVSNTQKTTALNEGFDNVIGTSSSITSGIPTGWTFSSGLGLYTTSGNYGASSPAIKLQDTGNQIITPSLDLSAKANLSFWIKGNGTNSSSHLLVEQYNGTSWTTIEDIANLPINGATKNYTLGVNTKQVRFTYTKVLGNLALDDIKIQ